MTENFKSVLENILKKDKRLVDDSGELNGNLIHEYASSLDEGLIELLLNEEATREKFFLKVKDVYVFKQNDFKFFLDENKIDNSYTQYANRIGLSTGGKFLKDIDDVVLDFPYKDCVLEGGQSTEEGTDTYFEYDENEQDYIEKEAKRKEIFFNQILAKDEIDRLTEPKAFTNIKRYTEKGEDKITSFNRNEKGQITDNLIIKGNNLLALHSLHEQFQGKIKLIYIDPPYNTGDDEFKYNDKFNHSTWLTFMSNRFKNAEKLLNNDGFLVVQCDDNEQAYLKVLMDNVLKMNFLTTICVQMSYVSGEKMAHIDKKPPKIKEYLHIYSKKTGNKIIPQYTTKGVDFEYNKYIVKNDSQNSKDWDVVNLNEIFKKHKIKDDEQKEEFMLENASLIFNRVRNKTDVFKNTLGNKKLQKITTPTGLEKWAWNGREVVFLSDRIITDHEGNLTYSQALGDIWDDIPIVNLYLEGDVKLLRGKKPEFLINRIIEMLSKPEDIILDYHLGSGTTAAVCHKNQRQYIGIEQLDYGENDSVIRLKNVINGDSTGISEVVDWKGGGSFVYCELAKNNQKAIDKIMSCKSLEELIALFDELYEKYFLNYNVKVREFKEKIVNENEFQNLSLERQKEIFARMLDLNQLYVNVSDMEDSRFKLSDKDIALTKNFYQI
ncbi:adenine-specific DNA-methyltransferase [Marinilabilia salmonicolor]|jgi:adenine-specific DNA-methyltransferase|uniref:site-specific DNA-methyltransferase n=1 Tax=Marinilabilia salmonicolor TaxID=989 RepID=UPI000D059CDE|nr:site-specific DNA-methyltransferase [Marinilabilia salmonicolor]PRY87380.1 adenine-specific DNA-methyltransferase [Marinilabilia salmonicolor]